MSDHPSIHQALAAVMGDVQAVKKGDYNQHQKFNFRGIDAVVNAVGPALRKHGVIVVPSVQSVSYDDVTTSTGKASTACRVIVSYTFSGPAGDMIEATVVGEAWDSGDKAAPKAMSVAYRIALLQALCIPTDEPDPDHEVYEKATGLTVAAAKTALVECATAAGCGDPKAVAAAVWKFHDPSGPVTDEVMSAMRHDITIESANEAANEAEMMEAGDR